MATHGLPCRRSGKVDGFVAGWMVRPPYPHPMEEEMLNRMNMWRRTTAALAVLALVGWFSIGCGAAEDSSLCPEAHRRTD
jgi:hypothetical protein